MKVKHLYSLLFLIIAGFFFFSAFTSDDEEDHRTNKDIIKFSHSLHSEISDCASCHNSVEASESLTDRLLPEKDVCAECHDIDDDENCELCHYEDVYEALIIIKSELIFSHRYHGEELEMECTDCHIGFEEVDYSFEAVQPNPPMDNCYRCHNDMSVASNACESCHIVTANLLPSNHKTVDFNDTHKFLAMESGANCAMCHDRANCEACHVATIGIDESNTASDFYTPYSPYTYIDGIKQQQITLVHGLNYRYTHGIDAKGKDMECQTCHQTETFCATCHNPEGGGDYALGGIVPYSHTQTDFLMGGVGSGGGQHAVLAKRDIERCASCHDLQGADPNCLICHHDADGIQGTNPKTHETNYMFNENGDWHRSDASVCYNCHTGSSASTGIIGVGFCGYCHEGL
jgi:hypothetical protein